MLSVLYRPWKCKANAPLLFVKELVLGILLEPQKMYQEAFSICLESRLSLGFYAIGVYGAAYSSLSLNILSMTSLLFFPRKFSK